MLSSKFIIMRNDFNDAYIRAPLYSFYEINIFYRSADALGIIINFYRHKTLVYLDFSK